MKREIVLLKDWDGFKSGSILRVDEATFAELTEQKIAKVHVETADAAKTDNKDLVDATVTAVEARIKDMLDEKTKQAKLVATKDLSDNDPCHGYLPGNSKGVKELSKDEINYAFGNFCSDVVKASRGTETDLLKKSRERTSDMVKKAAGTGMIVGGDAEGGYAIFPAASQLIQASALEEAVVRPRANRIPLGTQILNIPYLRDNTHSGNIVYGGIMCYFDDELEKSQASRPALSNIELKLKKITALGFVSEEWLKWSPVSLGGWLIPRFGEAVGFKEDVAFISGTGAGQPLGLLNSKAAITVNLEQDQDANTFVLENSSRMLARLRKRNKNSIVWLMNPTMFPQLPQLNVTAGTGGTAVFTNNVTGAPGQSIWGYPIVETEKIPASGNVGAITLVDLSDYLIADDQAGPEIAQSIHLKFDYGQTAFRLVKYIDGQSESNAPFTPLNGDSMSPVVKLGTSS